MEKFFLRNGEDTSFNVSATDSNDIKKSNAEPDFRGGECYSFGYDDILNYKYPNYEIEKDFPDEIIRAAQFAPFAALTGYDDAVRESSRQTTRKIRLDEYEKSKLDVKLMYLNQGGNKAVKITYFKPDEKKSGGRYLTVEGVIERVDEYERKIILDDKTEISVDDVLSIEE